MNPCFFVSDLHGRPDRYQKLFERIASDRPQAVFLGGDLLPTGLASATAHGLPHSDFVGDFLARELEGLRENLKESYPRLFLILGNDDSRLEETAVHEGAARGLWEYVHDRSCSLDDFRVFGYACVPPTPFLLKDWERYDVSRYVDPGSVSPEEGYHSAAIDESEVKYGTIAGDLKHLTEGQNLDRSIFLFHAPPYQSRLDRAALDGRMVDHVPLDVHIGSIALRRFIEERQPLLTLHGHVHEAARLSGDWRDRIGRTVCLSAAHDGPELALVIFDPADPRQARRELV